MAYDNSNLKNEWNKDNYNKCNNLAPTCLPEYIADFGISASTGGSSQTLRPQGLFFAKVSDVLEKCDKTLDKYWGNETVRVVKLPAGVCGVRGCNSVVILAVKAHAHSSWSWAALLTAAVVALSATVTCDAASILAGAFATNSTCCNNP